MSPASHAATCRPSQVPSLIPSGVASSNPCKAVIEERLTYHESRWPLRSNKSTPTGSLLMWHDRAPTSLKPEGFGTMGAKPIFCFSHCSASSVLEVRKSTGAAFCAIFSESRTNSMTSAPVLSINITIAPNVNTNASETTPLSRLCVRKRGSTGMDCPDVGCSTRRRKSSFGEGTDSVSLWRDASTSQSQRHCRRQSEHSSRCSCIDRLVTPSSSLSWKASNNFCVSWQLSFGIPLFLLSWCRAHEAVIPSVCGKATSQPSFSSVNARHYAADGTLQCLAYLPIAQATNDLKKQR